MPPAMQLRTVLDPRMVDRILVVGAGGFGRETLDVIEAINHAAIGARWMVLGVADDGPSAAHRQRLAARGYAHLGSISQVLAEFEPAFYAVGIGSPRIRRDIAKVLDDHGWHPATLVHPHAVVGTVAAIGAGSVICGGVQLSTNTVLSAHVHLNPGAIIGHDAILDEFVSVNPGAILSGDVRIGAGVLIGAGAVVLQGLNVGTEATVGASACVTRDVAPGTIVKGVPAR